MTNPSNDEEKHVYFKAVAKEKFVGALGLLKNNKLGAQATFLGAH